MQVQDLPEDIDTVAIKETETETKSDDLEKSIIGEAETEIKSEEFFLDLERSNIDETDLEPETDNSLDNNNSVAIEKVGTKNIREARYLLERIELLELKRHQMDKGVSMQ